MPRPPKTFYITTPIYYVNDVPHVGHAYTTIAADAIARYHRARGDRTRFLTGTDEHGEKVEEVAKKNGLAPKAWADKTVVRFQEAWKVLGIANDDFIRTTDERHAKVVVELWKRMRAKGDLTLGVFEGKYCVGCEEKKTESDLDAEGRCPQHPNRPLETRSEPSWVFAMSRYRDALVKHIETHPEFITPDSRRNEVLSFLTKETLRDLHVSRTTFSWGIPVPDDPKHVIYVWIDALTNYVSALGGPGAADYETFWPEAIHMLGKDIVRFHAVYWPCMLMSAGLPLPKQLATHGWWTVRGQKISKSLPATKVDPVAISADIGADALRYYLLREIPFGNEGDFTYEGLIGRYNSDLANDLGNLLNRTLSLTEKFFDGVSPSGHPELDAAGIHLDIAGIATRALAGTVAAFDSLAPSRALESTWELVRAANKYVEAAAPWQVVKDPARRRELEHIIHVLSQATLWAAWMAAPVIPERSAEIIRQLGLPVSANGKWPTSWESDFPAGLRVAKAEVVFPKIDADREKALLEKWLPPETLAASAAKPPDAAKKDVSVAPPSPISFDDFSKLDLRVALVKAAERVPKADKLLKLTIDLGTEERTVVSGIAEAYAPETLVGKKVILLANLAPKKIRGVESHGMILAAGDESILGLSAIDKDVPPGTKVR